MPKSKPVRVRFAPSPTGHMHLGSARTALYDYLLAQQTNGQFILRIEDTDRNRYVKGAEEELIEGLHWLGIDWDEGPIKGGRFGPYRQSERKNIYLDHVKMLIEKGSAYYCFCTQERLKTVREQKLAKKIAPHYDGFCRNISPQNAQDRVDAGEMHVIRFKSPKEGVTVVNDVLRGEIEFDNKNLDDFILIKSDGWALYHLAAIVDDFLMKITHVIRGSEWLPTSPLHVQIWQAFGWEAPEWVHLSVFLKPSGKGKMSKRETQELSKDGYSIFVKDLGELGYLPEAVVNWMALMGWSYDDSTEFFTLEDLVQKFSLEKLNPSPAAINFTKLDHFNKLHIKSLSNKELSKRLVSFFEKEGISTEEETLLRITPALKDRLTTLNEAVEKCTFLFRDEIEISHDELIIKDLDKSKTLVIANKVLKISMNIENWNVENLDKVISTFMNEENLTPRQLLSFLREAISGQKVTPPLFESMYALGKKKTISRIKNAISLLS